MRRRLTRSGKTLPWVSNRQTNVAHILGQMRCEMYDGFRHAGSLGRGEGVAIAPMPRLLRSCSRPYATLETPGYIALTGWPHMTAIALDS